MASGITCTADAPLYYYYSACPEAVHAVIAGRLCRWIDEHDAPILYRSLAVSQPFYIIICDPGVTDTHATERACPPALASTGKEAW